MILFVFVNDFILGCIPTLEHSPVYINCTVVFSSLNDDLLLAYFYKIETFRALKIETVGNISYTSPFKFF